MSAFGGIVRFDGEPVERGDLDRLAAALDGPGLGRPVFWRGSGAGPGVGFVHRQRVVTPEDRDERQPWIGWNGDGVLVFDGRLDDRPGLIAALDLGNEYAAAPDGLLVRLALERWGDDAPARLLGDFAVAWWDGAGRRLRLIRDALGARALYHHRNGESLAFATTLRAMLALPDVPRALDPAALGDLFVLNQRDAEPTLWVGVRRVPPATLLTHNADKETQNIYWRPDLERRLTLRTDDAYVEAARAELDRAVACRLRAVGPVPQIGGGGLDSSCVAVSALGLMGGKPHKLLTLIPAAGRPIPATVNCYPSEQPLVTALAARFPGLDPEFIPGGLDPADGVESPALRLAGAVPFRNTGNATWFAPVYPRVAELGAAAVLEGNLGNWTLTWNGLRGLSDLFRQGRWLRLGREALALGEGRPRWALGFIRREVVRPLLAQPRPGAWRDFSALSAGAANTFDIEGRLLAHGHDPLYRGPFGGRALRIHYMGSNFASRGGDARAAFRARWGIETRMPLADRRMIELCLAIPQDQFLKNGEPRHLARRILRAAGAPAAIADNHRHGLQNPEWFSSMDRDACAADLERAARSPLAAGLLDVERLRGLIDTWPADAEAAQRRYAEYGLMLPRALHLASFIRWAEGGNE